MKVVLGFSEYVEKEFELPKKFEFLFDENLDEENYTDEQWDLQEEFCCWTYETTHCCEYDEVDIISIK
jgi:hypothetical protein